MRLPSGEAPLGAHISTFLLGPYLVYGDKCVLWGFLERLLAKSWGLSSHDLSICQRPQFSRHYPRCTGIPNLNSGSSDAFRP